MQERTGSAGGTTGWVGAGRGMRARRGRSSNRDPGAGRGRRGPPEEGLTSLLESWYQGCLP